MEKDLKELLLKDLCGRLPYGIKGNFLNSDGSLSNDPLLRKVSITYNCLVTADGNEGMVLNGDLKPYLFPLSSMTEEQAEELFRIFGLECPSTEEDYIKINEVTGITFFLNSGFDVETHLDKLIDWLNKNHFDYRGLIPKGLALDATDLNIY